MSLALLRKTYVDQRENGSNYSPSTDFPGDVHFSDVKLADVPAWIARRDKTPMGIYQGGIRSTFDRSICMNSE